MNVNQSEIIDSEKNSCDSGSGFARLEAVEQRRNVFEAHTSKSRPIGDVKCYNGYTTCCDPNCEKFVFCDLILSSSVCLECWREMGKNGSHCILCCCELVEKLPQISVLDRDVVLDVSAQARRIERMYGLRAGLIPVPVDKIKIRLLDFVNWNEDSSVVVIHPALRSVIFEDLMLPTILSDPPSLEMVKNIGRRKAFFERQFGDWYAKLNFAHGGVEDILPNLISTAKTFADFLSQMVDAGIGSIMDVASSLAVGVSDLVLKGKFMIAAAWEEMISAVLRPVLRAVASKLGPMIVLMAKTLARLWIGYDTSSLLFEILIDHNFVELLSGSSSLYSKVVAAFSNQFVAQSGETVNFVGSLLLFAVVRTVGVAPTDLRDFSAISRIAATIIPKDSVTFLNDLPFIGKLFEAEAAKEWTGEFPKTMAYVKAHGELERYSTFVTKRAVAELWCAARKEHAASPRMIKYLTERKIFPPPWLGDMEPTDRKCPRSFYLVGDSGAGKSVMAELLVACSQMYCVGRDYFPKDLSKQDFCWTYKAGKFCDGLTPIQLMTLMSDLFSKDDSGDENNSADFYMKSVDTAAHPVNMANLEDKKMLHQPAVVLSTSNIRRERFRSMKMGLRNPEALERRIYAYVEVKPRKRNAKGRMEVDEKFESHDQWLCQVSYLDDPNPIEMTFVEVLTSVCEAFDWYFGPKEGHSQISPSLANILGKVTPDQTLGDVLLDQWLGEAAEEILDEDARYDADFQDDGSGLGEAQAGDNDLRGWFNSLRDERYFSRFFGDFGSDYVQMEDLQAVISADEEKIDNELDSPPVEEDSTWMGFFFAGYSNHVSPLLHADKVKFVAKFLAVTTLGFGIGTLAAKGYDKFREWRIYKEEKSLIDECQLYENSLKCNNLRTVNRIEYGDKAFDRVELILPDGSKINGYVEGQAEAQMDIKAMKKKQSNYHHMEMLSQARGQVLSSKVEEQLPVLMRSIFRLVGLEDNSTPGFATGLSPSEFVTAHHVMLGLQKGFKLIPIKEGAKTLYVSNGLQKHFTFEQIPGVDVALVTLHYQRMDGVRDHHPKVVQEFRSGEVVRLQPDDKVLGGYASVVSEEEYSDGVRVITSGVHRVPVASMKGQCGLPYIRNGKHNQSIVGIHVAGNSAEECSMMAPITQTSIESVKCFQHPRSRPVCEAQGGDAQLLLRAGFCPEGQVETTVPFNRKTSLEPVPEMIKNKGMLEQKYGIARMQAFVSKGQRIDPLDKRLLKKGKRYKEKREDDVQLDDEIVDEAAQTLHGLRVKVFEFENKKTVCFEFQGKQYMTAIPRVDWNLVVRKNEYFKAVDPAKSAGPDCPGMSKSVYFVPGQIELTLTEEAWQALDVCLAMYYCGLYGTEISGLSLKDEKLPLDKVIAGDTRLFSPEGFFRYVVMRYLFGDLLATLSVYGPQLGLMSGVTSRQLGEYVQEFVGHNVIASDVSGQDDSHRLVLWVVIFKVLLKAGWFGTINGIQKVHPDLPPLTDMQAAQYYAWISCAHTYYQLRKTIFRIYGAVASGQLITLFINLMSAHISNIRLLRYLRPLVPVKGLRFMSFGDDQWTVASNSFKKACEERGIELTKTLSLVYRSMGYVLTDAEKQPDLSWCLVPQATFCGRQFAYDSRNLPVMRLLIDRLVKSVQFCQVNRFDEVYPDQLLTFLVELALYPKRDYNSLLDLMCWRNGTRFRLFCPSHDEMYDLVEQESVSRVLPSVSKFVAARRSANRVKNKFEKVVCVAHAGEGPGPADSDMAVTPTQTGEELTLFEGSSKEAEVVPVYETPRDVEKSIHLASTDVFTRAARVVNVNWTVSNNQSDFLIDVVLPTNYFTANPNMQYHLVNFGYLYSGFKVTMILNCNQFQTGCVVLVASPKARIPSNVFEAMSVPHQFLNCGANQAVTLEIPWTHEQLAAIVASFKDAGSTLQRFDFCRVLGLVLVPLQSINVPSAEIAVFVELMEAKMMPGALTPFALTAQGEREQVTRGLLPAGRAVSTVSGALQAGSHAAQMVSGWCKPSVGVNNTRVVQNPAPMMPNGVGADTATHLALKYDSQSVPPECLKTETGMDPMSVEAQANIWTFLHEFSQVSGNPEEHILAAIPCTVACLPDQVTAPLPRAFYVARLAKYWHGTLEYQIDCIKSPQHNTTIELSVDYRGVVNFTPTTEGRSANLHRVIWNTQGSTNTVVRVPFIWDTHWRDSNLDAEIDDPLIEGPKLYIKVKNPLVRPDTVVDLVTYIVRVRVVDLELMWPYTRIIPPTPGPLLAARHRGWLAHTMTVDGHRKRVWRNRVGEVVSTLTPYKKLSKRARVCDNRVRECKVCQKKEKCIDCKCSCHGSFQAQALHNETVNPDQRFDQSATTKEWARIVTLGHEPVKTRDFEERFAGGELITSLRQIMKRFFITWTDSGNMVRAVNVWDPTLVPDALNVIRALFVFEWGGYRCKVVPYESGVQIYASYSPIASSSPNMLEPEQIYTKDPGQVAEVNVNLATSDYPLRVIENPDGIKMRAVALLPGDNENYAMYMAVAEDYTAFGNQFLSSFSLTVEAALENEPASLN